jgi:hypothetical protein
MIEIEFCPNMGIQAWPFWDFSPIFEIYYALQIALV